MLGFPSKQATLKKDIEKLEKLQRRCLRLCPKEITLPTLEERRWQIDMALETYKYMTDK